MTRPLSLLALALFSTISGAYAAPKIAGAKKNINRKLSGSSARQLTAALFQNVPGNENAPAKEYASAETELKISCNTSGQEACDLSLSGPEVIYGSAAETLYNDLRLQEFQGQIADAKIFTDAEEMLSIYCSKSLIPNGDRYACSVELR